MGVSHRGGKRHRRTSRARTRRTVAGQYTVAVLLIRCRACRAVPGDYCVSLGGKTPRGERLAGPHPARVQDAKELPL